MFSSNIKSLRNRQNLSQQQLSSELMIPRTTLSGWERGSTEPNIEMLGRIAAYFDISLDDLLTGNVEQIQHVPHNANSMRVLAITVDSENRGNIELVETRAEAGYIESLNDPEFMGELPRIYFPNIPQGTYRAFEIRGESMLPMEPGNIVITQYVENLSDIKDGKTYIIVGKNEGVVYKRVYKDTSRNQLTLVSDNSSYAPFSVHFAEVQQIWKYYAHLNFSDLKELVDNYSETKIQNIERKIDNLHSVISSKE